MPIGLTALFLGHSAQVFGQALMAPLALALLWAVEGDGRQAKGERRAAWVAAGLLLCLALFSHVGVSIIAATWLGLAWVLLARRSWRALGLTLAASGLAALALVYGDVALLHVQQVGQVGAKVASEGRTPNYNLIGRAWWLSYEPLGLLLLAPGLLVAAQRLRRGARGAGLALMGAWALTALLFLAVEVATGLQVRYLYFLAPVACVAAGALLGRLAERGRAGALVAQGAALLLVAQGVALWLGATLGGGSMSMIPLLR